MTQPWELRPLGDTWGPRRWASEPCRGRSITPPAIGSGALLPNILCWCSAIRILVPPGLAAFGRLFGTPRMHALIKYRHAECPEVSWLTNVEADGKVDWYGVKRATDWHTDSTYEDELPLLAILHAKEVPAEKGGTMFADMRAAYDALPDQRKELARRPYRTSWPQHRTRR